MKRKRRIVSIVILSLALLLSGCIGKRELNNLGIINLMGIDLTEEGRYKITVHIIKPSTGQGGQPSTSQEAGSAIWVGWAEGQTIKEAVKNIRAKTSWLLIWSHCDIFVLGERLSRQGISQVLDYFARNLEVRLTSSILTTPHQAWQILQHSHQEKKEPVSDQINGLIDNIQDWSMACNLNLKEILYRLSSGRQELVLGKLELAPADPVKQGQLEQSSSKSGMEQIDQVLTMQGSSVFSKDKLVGYLTPTETRGYLRLINQIHNHNMNLTYRQQLISLETYRSKSQIELDQKMNKYLIKIKEDSRLTEQDSDLHLISTNVIKQIQSKKEQAVIDETRAVLNKAIMMKADIFGLKDIFKRKDYNKWQTIKEDWSNYLETLDYQIQVKSTMRQAGMIDRTIMKKEAE